MSESLSKEMKTGKVQRSTCIFHSDDSLYLFFSPDGPPSGTEKTSQSCRARRVLSTRIDSIWGGRLLSDEVCSTMRNHVDKGDLK